MFYRNLRGATTWVAIALDFTNNRVLVRPLGAHKEGGVWVDVDELKGEVK
jgi:hypothetical protein